MNAKSRKNLVNLANVCDAIDYEIEQGNANDVQGLYDMLRDAMSDRGYSRYERAISKASAAYCDFVVQDRYMRHNSNDWGFDRYRQENAERTKLAAITVGQQELICEIFDYDEETVHNDLETLDRVADLYSKLIGLKRPHYVA